MSRITHVIALACLAGGCGSGSGGNGPMGPTGPGGQTGFGGTPSTPPINGGPASGPSIGGGATNGPSVGSGGASSAPAVNGGAVNFPPVGSSAGHLTSCADVARYAGAHGVSSSCLACVESSCCSELLGCYNDVNCLSYTQCYSANCTDLQSCGCTAQYPEGRTAFDGYLQCALNRCEKECVTVTVTSSSSGGPPSGSSGSSSGGPNPACAVSGQRCIQTIDCCNTVCDSTTGLCQ